MGLFDKPGDAARIRRSADKYERLLKKDPETYYFSTLDSVLALAPDLKISKAQILKHIDEFFNKNSTI